MSATAEGTEMAAVPREEEKTMYSTSTVASQSTVSVLFTQKATLWAALKAAMGAVVFGLEIGYFSEVQGMKSLQKVMTGDPNTPLTADQLSWISSCQFLVAALFALPFISSLFTDGIGRRWTIIIGGLLFAVSQTIQATANSPAQMWAGRLILGIPLSFCVTTVPMYLSEIAPKETRGLVLGLFQFTLCGFFLVSQLISYEINKNYPDDLNAFRYCIWYHVPVGLLTALAMFFNVESPRYLFLKNKEEEAEAVIYKLRKGAPKAHIARELELIKEDLEAERAMGKPTYKELFSGFPLRITIITMLVQCLQQLSGQNALNGFGPQLFAAAGLSDPGLINVMNTLVQFVFTIPSFLIVDKVGRRTLLLTGGIIIGLAALFIAVLGTAVFSRPDNCFDVTNCPVLSQTFNTTCPAGAVYPSLDALKQGVCAKVDAASQKACFDQVQGSETSTMLLECMYTGDQGPTAQHPFAHVSSGVGWTLIILIFLYSATFGMTLGPIGWTYNAEIAPLKYRAKILGMAAAANLFFNWLVNYITPHMVRAMQFPTFFLYFGFMCLATAIFFWLPETAGVPLELITEKFEKKLGVKYTEGTLHADPNRPNRMAKPAAVKDEDKTDEDESTA